MIRFRLHAVHCRHATFRPCLEIQIMAHIDHVPFPAPYIIPCSGHQLLLLMQQCSCLHTNTYQTRPRVHLSHAYIQIFQNTPEYIYMLPLQAKKNTRCHITDNGCLHTLCSYVYSFVPSCQGCIAATVLPPGSIAAGVFCLRHCHAMHRTCGAPGTSTRSTLSFMMRYTLCICSADAMHTHSKCPGHTLYMLCTCCTQPCTCSVYAALYTLSAYTPYALHILCCITCRRPL